MGGNVFKGKTDSIKSQNIPPTLDSYFKELKRIFPNQSTLFDSDHFISLGSVGKKAYSGDIDLGVSPETLLGTLSDEHLKSWGILPSLFFEIFEARKARAITATEKMIQVKAFLTCLSVIINDQSDKIHCEGKKITTGNLFTYCPQIDEQGNALNKGVQVDWVVGNLEWLGFSHYSAAYPEGSNVKGLHRTQLLLAAFSQANLIFNHSVGVKDKFTHQIVAKTPSEALKALRQRLGIYLDIQSAKDYHVLHDVLKADLDQEDYDSIVDTYLKILDKTRADIPDDLQLDWIERKDKLGLTGKFLPPSSALYNVKV